MIYPLQRVKVYRLNEDGKWEDQGTGHVTVDYLEVCHTLNLLTFITFHNSNTLDQLHIDAKCRDQKISVYMSLMKRIMRPCWCTGSPQMTYIENKKVLVRAHWSNTCLVLTLF